MTFTVFSRKVVWGGTPSITFIKNNGRFAFNKAATAIFENNAIENVLLMWDADNNLIGVRPITKKDTRSYKVTMGTKGNGCGFSAIIFLKFIGFDTTKTVSFPVKWNEKDGIFTIEIPNEYLTAETDGAVMVNAGKNGQ